MALVHALVDDERGAVLGRTNIADDVIALVKRDRHAALNEAIDSKLQPPITASSGRLMPEK